MVVAQQVDQRGAEFVDKHGTAPFVAKKRNWRPTAGGVEGKLVMAAGRGSGQAIDE